jgi:hypothetical protein
MLASNKIGSNITDFFVLTISLFTPIGTTLKILFYATEVVLFGKIRLKIRFVETIS